MSSGYSLKFEIAQHPKLKRKYPDPDKFTVYANGHIIKDEVSLDIQNITNNSIITVHTSGKGGVSTITIVFWIAIILYAIVVLLLISSGLMTMLSYLYGFLLKSSFDTMIDWMFKYPWVGMAGGILLSLILSAAISPVLGGSATTGLAIGALVGTIIAIAFWNGYQGCLEGTIRMGMSGVNFIIKHSIVFLILFIALSALNYPLLGIWYQDHCQTLYLAKYVALLSALAYLAIYALYNIPNMIYDGMKTVSDFTTLGQVAITPSLTAQQNLVNSVKYEPLYIVNPALQMMHSLMALSVNTIYGETKSLQGFNCEDTSKLSAVMRQLSFMLIPEQTLVQELGGEQYKLLVEQKDGPYTRNFADQISKNIPDALKQGINDYKLQKTILYAWKGSTPKVFDKIEKDYEQSGFFTKMDFLGLTKTGSDYYMSYLAQWIICSLITGINDTGDYFNYVGDTSAAVVDTLQSSNVAGMFMTVVYIILMAVAFLFPSWLGYL